MQSTTWLRSPSALAAPAPQVAASPVDWVREIGLLCLAVAMVLPLWSTKHPPIEDWPQHLAAVRVLHSHSDPAFGLRPFFRVALGHTEYLTVYLATHGLAYLFGITAALKLVLSAGLVGLPLGVRSLARALGRSGDVAVLALPLAYSAHTILGFVNFVVAVPLALWGLALGVQQRKEPRGWRLWLQPGVLILCFYTHVVPFAFGLAGAVLLAWDTPHDNPASRSERLRGAALRLLPTGSTALCALPWLCFSPAGRSVLGALGLSKQASTDVAPVFQSAAQAWEKLPVWLTDVWREEWSEQLLLAWLVLCAIWCVSGLRLPARAAPLSLSWRLAVLPLLAGLGYFFAPVSYAWIWPINARFALLAVAFALPLFGEPPKWLRRLWVVAGALLALIGLGCIERAFADYEHELGDIDAAIAHIPRAQKVAGLIWSRESDIVKFAPFLHSVAYYQARSGGAVMFTFADFPESPFRFSASDRPPRVGPRWEWLPDRVEPDRDLGWYDWLLTRGGPNPLEHAEQFALAFETGPWRVWRRERSATARESSAR